MMAAIQDAATPLHGRTILVVEDQFLIAEELRAVIERLGGAVMGPLSSATAAISALRTATPDCALLDVNLSGETVYAVADALQSSQTPFTFVTGYRQEVLETRFRDAPYLEKPVTASAVVRALCAMVKH